MASKVIMPEMGEGVIEGTIARWLKQEGDPVDKYEPILEIETDKVTTEATAEVAGTLLKIEIPEGKTVPVGTVLAYIGQPGDALDGDETAEAEPEPVQAGGAAVADQPPASRPRGANGASQASRPAEKKKPYTGRISPVVGRIAAEHEVDLSEVEGTGRDGRITKQDILAYLEKREAAAEPVEVAAAREAPKAAPATAVPGETLPMTSMRRAIAEHMVRSKQTSPHVTTVFEVNFDRVAAHRAAHKEPFARDGVNLTYTAYIAAAAVAALKAHPLANSSWSDEGILVKRAINIGLATAIEDGLIVPVIKNADGYNLLGLARVINDLAQRARSKQLQPADVQGGTFSITNHGVSGSLFATPIINQPQTAIMGVGKIEKRVIVIDDAIAIRPLAYVSLTFDHRVLDGAGADGFVSTFKERIEGWT